MRADASIRVAQASALRGVNKLGPALDTLGIGVAGRVAVDIGAAAGGFTTALLDRDVHRVYAVDVGYGQLLGSLRQDPRVVNLERTNVAALGTELVPEPVELIAMDLSYLQVAAAVPQLEGLHIVHRADLLALVKPTFELRRSRLEIRPDAVRHALSTAESAIAGGPWDVVSTTLPVPSGADGAVEAFVHARRR